MTALLKTPDAYAAETLEAFAGDRAAALSACINGADEGHLARMPRGWIASVAAELAPTPA